MTAGDRFPPLQSLRPLQGSGALSVGGSAIPVGARTDLRVKVSESYTGDRLSIPVTVVSGVQPGPVLFVTAAIHGDELNGIAVVRELLGLLEPAEISGAVICVPVVNVLGVQFHSRYLPDRRDLNRCFPGSPLGSTASRIAATLMEQVVVQADVGIDLHTAANRRMNLPQIRADLFDPRAHALGMAFGAPYLIATPVRPGSLRDAAAKAGVPVLTYEGGQALRFEEDVIAVGVAGVVRVMAAMGMVEPGRAKPSGPTIQSDETHWVRADRGGILDLHVGPGDHVIPGQPLWTVTGPFGRERNQELSAYEGHVVGMTTLPLVNPGDAVVHIAVAGCHDRLQHDPWIDEPTDEEDVAAGEDDADDDEGT